MASACAGVEVALYGNILGLLPLLVAGGPELKRELLRQHCSGSNVAALCLTEAGAGSDVGSTHTKTRRIGDEYSIDGTKRFVTNGGKPASMRSLPTSSQNWGTGAYQLSLSPRDAPGFSLSKREHKMGQRSCDRREVIFEEVCILAHYREGEGFDGFKSLLVKEVECRL